jgi:hypothetical protein
MTRTTGHTRMQRLVLDFFDHVVVQAYSNFIPYFELSLQPVITFPFSMAGAMEIKTQKRLSKLLHSFSSG